MSEWLEEDKKFLNNSVTLKEIDKFVTGDFDVVEINNEKRLRNGIIKIF
jgi:hypothetical protein